MQAFAQFRLVFFDQLLSRKMFGDFCGHFLCWFRVCLLVSWAIAHFICLFTRYPTLIPEVVLVARVVGDRQLSHTNQTLRIVVSAGRAQVETAPHASLGGSGRTAFAPHLVVHIRGVALLLYGGGIAGAGAVPVKHIVARGLMTLTAGTPVANQRVLAQLNYLFR